jgi:signal transduction histidine kinase
VIVPDVEADYRVEEPYLKTTGVRSVAGLPMLAGEELMGVVIVGHRRPHAFPPEEVQRLDAIVRRTAQAIERARALDAFQRSAQGLEAQLAAQVEALQKSAAEQAEARQQAQEARKRAQELEQRIKAQAAEPPRVKEVVVEREVVRPAGAEEAARVRAQIQKTVSEELRAPLTALLELPRFLVDGLQKPLGDAERAQLEILQERSQEIVELIEGLAVWTALQSGPAPGGKSATDLAGLVQRVVRALQPRASARGNRIEVDVKPGTGQVVTDARRLEQILKNLLLSAVKFTEVGEIRVTCYQAGGETVITVADDGIGFTPQEQGRIFQPFLSVGPRGGRALPGTGLLLAVAERLAAAIGGKIRVESELDRGTWVTVTLPAQG